jgi:hypothetical protein
MNRGSNIHWIRAVSGFVVIVVGVLVALALDNWVGDRADRRSEVEYLSALSNDLRSDSTLLTDLLVPQVARADSALAAIVPAVRGEAALPVDTISFLRQVIFSSRGFTQIGSRTTFDELLATGSLRLVESAALRSAIVAYYGSKTLAKNRAQSRASRYEPLVRGYLPETQRGPIASRADEAAEASIRDFGIQRAVEAIRTPEFAEAMNRHVNYIELVGPMLDAILVEVEELIPRVDAELDRLR